MQQEESVRIAELGVQELALTHPTRSVEFGYTTLQTYIAAALVRCARIQPGHVVVDPMCGVGTIPIEGALDVPHAMFLGGDLDKESVLMAAKAEAHTRKKHGGRVQFFHWDATALPLASESVDVIICDMPWGRRSGSAKENRIMYPKLFREWARVLRPGGYAYPLTLERALVQATLKELVDVFVLEENFEVDVSHKVG